MLVTMGLTETFPNSCHFRASTATDVMVVHQPFANDNHLDVSIAAINKEEAYFTHHRVLLKGIVADLHIQMHS